MNKLEGIIEQVQDTVQVTEKFKKRVFILLTDADTDYPQHVSIQKTQDRCAELDNYKAGDKVSVDINIRGKKWKSPTGEIKHFVTLEAWKMEKLESTPEMDLGNGSKETLQPTDESDDLPF